MALLKDTANVKQYVAIDVNTSFSTLKPFIEQAEQLFLVPLLGQAFYDEFNTAYQASIASTPVPLSADNLALLPYIQLPLTYYMLVQGNSQLGVAFGDMGLQQNFGAESQPAPLWKAEKFEFDNIANADLFADKLLEFLEKNASISKYATWFNDPTANTFLSGAIVRNATIANKYIEINNSRRVFMKLKKMITLIESRYVPKLIGDDQYNLLVAHIKLQTVTADEALLLLHLEPIIAKMALEKSIPTLDLNIGKDGITIYSSNNSIIQRSKPSDQQIADLKEQLRCEENFGYEADEFALQDF